MNPLKRRLASAEPRFVGYAGFLSRALAMSIDLIIIAVIWIGSGIALDFLRRTTGVAELLNLIGGALSWIATLNQAVFSIVFELSSLLVLSQIYFTFFFSVGGASIGKLALGLRVVRSDGRPLGVVQAALRSVAYAASSLLLYFGFLMVLSDDQRRALHDRIAGTVVVYAWRPYTGEDGA